MIRVATINDLDIIVRNNILLAKETENLDLDESIVQKGVKKIITDKTKGSYFLYLIDDVIIGQTLITYEWSDWRNKDFWWVQSVYVNINNRNQKVFKNLFNYLVNLAKDLDSCGIKLYVDQNNLIAKNSYASLGLKLSHYELYELYF